MEVQQSEYIFATVVYMTFVDNATKAHVPALARAPMLPCPLADLGTYSRQKSNVPVLEPASPLEPNKRDHSAQRNHGQSERIAAHPVQLGIYLKFIP
jgi:hypothetical protein